MGPPEDKHDYQESLWQMELQALACASTGWKAWVTWDFFA
jgi:hypothetical protein